MSADTDDMKANIETATAAAATQNAAAATSESPLASTPAAATPVGVQAAPVKATPLNTIESGVDQEATAVKKDAERDTRGVLHIALAKALAELKTIGLYTEQELEHIEAVFKKHI